MIGRERHEKTLQVRVPTDTAQRFTTIAKARGMTTSQLVRTAIDQVMREADRELDSLRERLHRQYLAEQRALGLSVDESDDEDADITRAAGKVSFSSVSTSMKSPPGDESPGEPMLSHTPR